MGTQSGNLSTSDMFDDSSLLTCATVGTMACIKDHTQSDSIVKTLRISQGNFERHKCASCAYEQGLENGKRKILHFDIEDFIVNLEDSQKGDRRHRSALEAYTLGFFHGLSGANSHRVIKDKLNMASQMRSFGMAMISRGVLNASFWEGEFPYAHAQSVINIANGFEILIKAKIVEEHPLLVFEQIPKESKITDGNLKFEDLLEHGKTIMYSELPERLWASTGYKISDLNFYNDFGRTRNKIIHFTAPMNSLADYALKFAFTVVEKSIFEWWGTSIFEFLGEFHFDDQVYVLEQLQQLGLPTKYQINAAGELEKREL